MEHYQQVIQEYKTMKRYFICKNNFDAAVLRTFDPVNSILDWNCFSLDAEDTNSIKSLPGYAVEVDKEIAIFGLRSFGDIRSTIKISTEDISLNEEFDNLSYSEMSVGPKMQIPMTEKRYNTVMRTMKLFAKIIIDDTFNNRFEALDDGVVGLEKKTWEFLVNDIENGTDFILSELAEVKGMSVDGLKTLVTQKRDFYNKSVKDLYVKSTSLKKEFYDCNTIRQLNRLYEDYTGLPMPEAQAYEEKRIDPETGTRSSVIPGLKF